MAREGSSLAGSRKESGRLPRSLTRPVLEKPGTAHPRDTT